FFSALERATESASPRYWANSRGQGMPATSLVIATTQLPAPQRVMPLRMRHRIARNQYRIAPAPVGAGAKRMIDFCVAAAALVSLSPVLFLIALLIVIESPGAVFFRQHRTGFRGRRFKIIKFRTMSVSERGRHAVQAQLGDPRITRLGAW